LGIEVDHPNKEIASMTNYPNVISISQISREGFGTNHPPYRKRHIKPFLCSSLEAPHKLLFIFEKCCITLNVTSESNSYQ